MLIRGNKSKKIIFLSLVCSLFIILAACTSGENEYPNSQIKHKSQRAISYEDYIKLCNTMANDMVLPTFTKVEDNINTPTIIFVDKPITFGKRNVLTLTGEQTNQSTQRRIIYSDNNKKTAIKIDLIYLERELENDLLFTSLPSKNRGLNEVTERFTQDIFAYNNILVNVTIYSSDKPITMKLQNEIDVAVVNFLQNYKTTK
ncbi:hypothetical protein ACTID9_06125 [Brevibacillus fluminis]|uniref:hypothetical protein n=1 Tax=Brevibacillus fluminis TaxID=511487 RepID=UPI003F88F71D